jgi:hypothetical protein
MFELRTPNGVSLRTELRDTVEAAAETLGFRPVLDTSGPVDSAVPDDIVPEILAVVREALANVARHVRATMVRVSVRAADGQITVIVQDDGIGADASLARGGLVNLLDRATDLGGTFDVRRAEGGAPSSTGGSPSTADRGEDAAGDKTRRPGPFGPDDTAGEAALWVADQRLGRRRHDAAISHNHDPCRRRGQR